MKRDAAWYAMTASGLIGALMIIAAFPALLPVWAGVLAVAGVAALSRRLFRPRITRRCLVCDYRGPMTTVLQTTRGGLFAVLLFLAMLVPGVLYVIWRWNSPICPRCGSIKRAVID